MIAEPFAGGRQRSFVLLVVVQADGENCIVAAHEGEARELEKVKLGKPPTSFDGNLKPFVLSWSPQASFLALPL
jgi:hypothetical protein